VRTGNTIEVSGTAAVDGDTIVGEEDACAQTRFILKKIQSALKQAGARMKDVTRTRIYVTDISRWKEVARVHAEFFGKIKPATSMLEVKALIHPKMLVEIEVTAVTVK
jgi:enamine deaminase RidA (YjgF/YER057c/UK114 family)